MKVEDMISSLFMKKQFVFILSTMRSGSTLLKSLLAVPKEVSHLPEVRFRKYRFFPETRLSLLAKEPIIVLKKPSWLGEKGYSQLPKLSRLKKIILIRHPYETITSILEMNDKVARELRQNWSKEELLKYWNVTYAELNDLRGSGDTFFVRYEDLVETPKAITKSLFLYIGLKEQEGINTYFPPEEYEWQWFNDDGGEKIKSLKVASRPIQRTDRELVNLIEYSSKTSRLLEQYGYDTAD